MADRMHAPWTIAPIRIMTQDGREEVPGWTNGVLGIDWRPGSIAAPASFAYVLTHLATGYAICAICDDFPAVVRAADEIAGAMDWYRLSLDQLRATDPAGDLRKLIALRDGHSARYYLPPAGLEPII